MTTTEKITAITKTVFEDYILNCFTPDDFNGMTVERWSEILPEIEEHFTEHGQEFPFTEADVPVIKAVVDIMFQVKFDEEPVGYAYRFASLIDTYGIDAVEAILVKAAHNNLNTDAGYRAYYLLDRYIAENHLSMEILFDLAADFAWDDRLEKAVKALYEADGIEFKA